MKNFSSKIVVTILAVVLVFQLCLGCINEPNVIAASTSSSSVEVSKNEVSKSTNVEITYLSLSSGDSTLVKYLNENNKTESKNGTWEYVLIDCGGKGDEVAAYLQKQGISNLQAVILTHQHSDHVSGLQYLTGKGIAVERIYLNNIFRKEPTGTYTPKLKNMKALSEIKTNVTSCETGKFYTNQDDTLYTFKEFANLTANLKRKSGGFPLVYMIELNTAKNTSRSIKQILKNSKNELLSSKVEFYLYVPSNYWKVTGVAPKSQDTRPTNDSSMMVQVVNNNTTSPYKYLFGGDIHVESMYDWMHWLNANKEINQFKSQEFKISHHFRRSSETDIQTTKIPGQPSTLEKYKNEKYKEFQKKYSVEKSFIKYYVMGYVKETESFPYSKYKLISSMHSTLFNSVGKGEYVAATKLLEDYLSETLKKPITYLKDAE